MTRGIVLFGHGSRDPRWHTPIEAVARRIAALSPQTQVCCAYLELTPPSLPTAIEGLVAQGVTDVRVLPMFLGMGRHAREDLPAMVNALRASHPTLQLSQATAVGEHPALIEFLAQLALEPDEDASATNQSLDD